MRSEAGGLVQSARLELAPLDPPVAPRFDTIANEWAANLGSIEDEERALVELRSSNIKAAAAAIAAGEKPADTSKAESDAEERIVKLKRRDAELTIAVDLAGNELADAIGDAAGEWAVALQQDADAARASLAAAVADALAALDRFGKASSAAEWLRAFHVGEAKLGLIRPWHGKSRTVTVDGPGLGSVDVTTSLRLIAKFAEPPAEPEPLTAPALVHQPSAEPARQSVVVQGFK